MNKKIKKICLFFTVGLVLFTPLVGLVPPFEGKAFASTFTESTPEQQSDALIAFYAIAECIRDGTLRTVTKNRITPSDAANWKWFQGDGPQTAHTTYVGYFDNEDGKKSCNEDGVLSSLYSKLNASDPIRALCLSGFTREGLDLKEDIDACINYTGTGDGARFERINDSETAANIFSKNVNDLYFRDAPSSSSGYVAPPNPSAAGTFYYNWHSFEVLCGGKESSNKASDAQVLANDTLYKAKWIDGNDQVFSSTKKKSDEVTVRAQREGNGFGDAKKTCKQLFDDAAANASAWKTYSDENPEAAQLDDSDDAKIECVNGGNILGVVPNPLDWLTCAAVNGLYSVSSGLENIIVGMLCINETDLFDMPMTCSEVRGDQSSRDGFYAAWSVFRILALAFIAIAGLIMVISQALGLEIIDAYTVKKVLPRILVAGVGISLSWALLAFLVSLSNGLGVGIRSIIYAPFNGIDATTAVVSGGDQALTALFAGGAFATLGALGILSFIGTAALALFIAFIVLVLRNIIVIFLVIAAPLAIAMYVLPNTEKYFKTWWDWLLKGLMVFPIITAMIAIGHVFAAITLQKDTAAISTFIAFAAYFAPYFLIPATFRFAGGAIATIGGFANDKSRGGFDRLSKFRQGQSAKNMEKIRNFDRFSERSKLGRGLNNALGTASNPSTLLGAKGGVKGLQRSVAAQRTSSQSMQGAAMLKDNKIFQANQNDDNFLLALANRDLANDKINQARTNRDSALASGNTVGANKYQAELDAREKGMDSANRMSYFDRENRSTRLGALDALTKTGYQFDDGATGYQQLNDTVTGIVGGDQRARAQLMDNSQFNLKSAGRYDLGGINNGAGPNIQTGLNKASLYELANGKPESIRAMSTVLPAGPAGKQHAVTYKELEAMLPNAKGGNRDAVVKEMQSLEANGVKEYMATTTSEQQVVKLTADRARDAIARGNPWSATELKQGWRHENREVTQGDVAGREARAYERPDPNQHQ